MYYNSYEHIKFLWGYTHHSFVELNKQLIQRMIELVAHDNIEELVSLQGILPQGMSVIDPITDKEAYKNFYDHHYYSPKKIIHFFKKVNE